MKHRSALFLFLGLLLAATPALSQKKYLREFHRQYRGQATTLRIGFGFIPIKLASWIIPGKSSEETATLKRLLKKINKFKLYIVSADDTTTVTDEAMHNLQQKLINEAHLEPLMTIRDNGSQVYVLNKAKSEDRLGNVVILAKDGEDLVLMYLRSRLHVNDIQDVIDRFAKS